jgi:hypothetical protein
MMARSTNAPFKGRIQKRKTNHLQIFTFGLQRTAGPYKGATSGLMHRSKRHPYSITSSATARRLGGNSRLSARAVFKFTSISNPTGCSTGSSAGLAPFRILST